MAKRSLIRRNGRELNALLLLDEDLMLGGKHLEYIKALAAAESLLVKE